MASHIPDSVTSFEPAYRLRGSRGFSMVELLVTIVLAGIVFAAMVPVFVSAQKQAVGDQVRNTALNLAQDHVEKIREMPFADIVSGSNLDATLGTTWTSYGGSSSKTYQISHTAVPDGATPTRYYKVTVTVRWNPPPAPVKEVVLRTIVVDQTAVAISSSPSASPTPTSSPSASPSASPSPSPSPSASVTPKYWALTVTTNVWSIIKSVQVTRTDVIPNTDYGTKKPDVKSSSTWTDLPEGTYLLTCIYSWQPNTTTRSVELRANTSTAFNDLSW